MSEWVDVKNALEARFAKEDPPVLTTAEVEEVLAGFRLTLEQYYNQGEGRDVLTAADEQQTGWVLR